MVTHSGIFAWEIPWTEEPGGLQSMGLQKSWMPLSIRVKPAFKAVQGNKKKLLGIRESSHSHISSQIFEFHKKVK